MTNRSFSSIKTVKNTKTFGIISTYETCWNHYLIYLSFNHNNLRHTYCILHLYLFLLQLIAFMIFDSNKNKIINDIKSHKLLNHQMALFRKTEEEEKHSLGQCCSCRLCTIIWLQVQLRVKLCFHISSSINKKTFFPSYLCFNILH